MNNSAQFESGSDEEFDEEYDEDEEFEDDEDGEIEEDAPKGGRGGPAVARKAERPAPTEWKGLATFPSATQKELNELLSKVKASGEKEVTIMLLGKNGVGKSSTGNSIFGEQVFPVNAFQASVSLDCKIASRTVGGFVLTVIDTPGLVDEDSVNSAALSSISLFVADKTINCILYVDRLDSYRVSTVDKAIMEALSNTFGPMMWGISVVTLTHGQLAPPQGLSYTEFVNQRLEGLKNAVGDAAQALDVPYTLRTALVENGSRCATNAIQQKMLPDGTVWLTDLISKVCDIVIGDTEMALEHDGMCEESDVYAKKKRWMIFPLLAVQMLLVKPLVVRQIKKDPDFN